MVHKVGEKLMGAVQVTSMDHPQQPNDALKKLAPIASFNAEIEAFFHKKHRQPFVVSEGNGQRLLLQGYGFSSMSHTH